MGPSTGPNMAPQPPQSPDQKPYGKWSWIAPVFMVLGIAVLLYTFSPPEPESVNGPHVAVSIKPLHSLVAGVMDGVGEPQLIMSGNASPHDYALKPSDARLLENAGVIFWIGPNMELALRKSLSTASEGGNKALVVQMTNNEIDPHIWLDPVKAADIVEHTAEQLILADPYNADRYRQNAARMKERLVALHADLRQRLAPVSDKPFIVFHDAYGHFAKSFGLNVAAVFTPSTDRRPGARRIANIRKLMRDMGVRCLFKEPQFDSGLLATAIEGMDWARIADLDPIGTELAVGKELYFDLMKTNVNAVLGCLSETP